MTFKILHLDTECNCIVDGFENTEKLFARKISKPTPKIADFKTHWERGKRPTTSLCYDICRHKGISINYWSENTQSQIISKYIDTLSYQIQNSKNIKDCILIFKFKNNEGLIVESSSKNDPSHCTFYKSDTFDVSSIEEVEIIELKNYV